jgi:thioredoxin-related protein
MVMKTFIAFIATMLVAVIAHSQAFNTITLTNVVDNKEYNLAKEIGAKPMVIVFYSNKCAYSEYYIDRIKSLNNEFSNQGVGFLFVNANNGSLVSEENPEGMIKYSVNKTLGIPYLADKDKQLKNYLKASRTPEVFLLTLEGESLKTVYKGAIDDSPQSIGDVRHQYLRDAIISLLNNTNQPVSQTRPVGCLIR